MLNLVSYFRFNVPLRSSKQCNMNEKNSRALPLVLFPHRRQTAALWHEGRSGKTSGYLYDGDNCHSYSTFTPYSSTPKKQRLATPREFFLPYKRKESICRFITLKQHILSYTTKKTSIYQLVLFTVTKT
jgi:hypothetical protein